MTVIASSLINWDALWKITLAALIGGAGVVIAFGFVLLGLKFTNTSKRPGQRAAGTTLAVACGVFCVAAVVIGIYAMAHKPKSKPAKPTKSALVAPARV